MCGRFAFYSAHEAMPALFDLDETIAVEASFNIAPTQRAAVIRLDDQKRFKVSMLRWGLVPFWAKDKAIGNKLINARAETAAEKPSFRAAYKKRRCLIPVDGFYEWVRHESAKQPYFIHAADNTAFCFGGLWESWSPPDSDEALETFTILTRAPNAKIQALHHRMPVIVEPAEYGDWLTGVRGVGDEATRVSETPNNFLDFRTVSTRVNSPRNNDEKLIDSEDQASS